MISLALTKKDYHTPSSTYIEPFGLEASFNTRGRKKRETFKCVSCGEEYTNQTENFPASQSPFFKANNSRLPVCIKCLNKYMDEYTQMLGSEDKALERMCLHFDIYIDPERKILNAAKRANAKYEDGNLMKTYISKCNLSQYKNKTYDTYMYECNNSITDAITMELALNREDSNRQEEEEINPSVLAFWGYGFNPEDYRFLQTEFADWKSRVIIDGKARESLVMSLCQIKLQMHTALLNNNIDLYNKLLKTYQDTLGTAHLQPKQEEDDDKATEKPMGVMIKMFENERPIPEPEEQWKDIDGIIKIITTFFFGHLCKVLGVKNRYSDLYEKEMSKYSATIEDISDEDDAEDIFEYGLEHGFANKENGTGDG